jgi:hypothetical protein
MSTEFVRGAGGALKLSQSYNFVDKREAVDELRTVIPTTRGSRTRMSPRNPA